MKSLSALLFALCLAGCHAGVTPILTDRAAASKSYDFVVVDADSAARVEADLDRSEIVTRFEKDGHVAYVVPAVAASKPGAREQGFAHLGHAVLKISVRRISDDGAGTWVNGEVYVARANDLHVTNEDVPSAFAELQAFETSPWTTLAKEYPTLLDEVAVRLPVHSLEKGFVLELQVELSGGNPSDAEKVAVLYSMHKRSPYMTTNWGVSL